MLEFWRTVLYGSSNTSPSLTTISYTTYINYYCYCLTPLPPPLTPLTPLTHQLISLLLTLLLSPTDSSHRPTHLSLTQDSSLSYSLYSTTNKYITVNIAIMIAIIYIRTSSNISPSSFYFLFYKFNI